MAKCDLSGMHLRKVNLVSEGGHMRTVITNLEGNLVSEGRILRLL